MAVAIFRLAFELFQIEILAAKTNRYDKKGIFTIDSVDAENEQIIKFFGQAKIVVANFITQKETAQ